MLCKRRLICFELHQNNKPEPFLSLKMNQNGKFWLVTIIVSSRLISLLFACFCILEFTVWKVSYFEMANRREHSLIMCVLDTKEQSIWVEKMLLWTPFLKKGGFDWSQIYSSIRKRAKRKRKQFSGDYYNWAPTFEQKLSVRLLIA